MSAMLSLDEQARDAGFIAPLKFEIVAAMKGNFGVEFKLVGFFGLGDGGKAEAPVRAVVLEVNT